MPREGGASSTPRVLGSSLAVSGILDRPLSRTMTAEGIAEKQKRRLSPAFCFSVCRVRSVEQRVDVVLRGVADVAGEPRAVEKLVVVAAGVDLRHDVRLDRVEVATDVHHRIDVLLDEL